MTQQDGMEISGEFSPFLRGCIGVAIVLLAAAPLTYVVLRWGLR